MVCIESKHVKRRNDKNIHEVKEKPQLAALVYHFVPLV
jgi:hypothetical protein